MLTKKSAESNTKATYTKSLVIIGSGAIASEVIGRLPSHIILTHIITSERSFGHIKEKYPYVSVIQSVDEIQTKPDFIIECAGHEAIKVHAPKILSRGWTLYIVSTGALADEALCTSFKRLTKQFNSELKLLSGAIVGIDGLRAAVQINKSDEPVKVIYRAIKPVKGWKNTPAEKLVHLDDLNERTCFFQGNARQAAQSFPQNANVAATIALNGIGFESTAVELFACPTIEQNTHIIHVEGLFGEIDITIVGNPLPNNPKTSFLTALSILQLFAD